MNIGKLKKGTFVDIEKDNNQYAYTYLLYSKSFLKKNFFKLTFEAKFPHYTFTDIMKVMRNEGYSFENLIDKSISLSIGSVQVVEFSASDNNKFKTDYNFWQSTFFRKAREKQDKYIDEYEKGFGAPDDLGLHGAYENKVL